MLSRPRNKEVIKHNQVSHPPPVPVKETLFTQLPHPVALSPKLQCLPPHPYTAQSEGYHHLQEQTMWP